MQPRKLRVKGPEIFPNGESLKRLRIERFSTQERLSIKARVSRRTVEHAEKGRAIRPATLRKLASALGVKVEAILEDSASPSFEARLQKMERRQKALEHFVHAEALRNAGGYDEALHWYNRVLASDASDMMLQAKMGIAKVYRRQAKYKEAIKMLDKILASYDADGIAHSWAHYNKACYLSLTGSSPKQILDELQAAIELSRFPRRYQALAQDDIDFPGYLKESARFKRLVSPSS